MIKGGRSVQNITYSHSHPTHTELKKLRGRFLLKNERESWLQLLPHNVLESTCQYQQAPERTSEHLWFSDRQGSLKRGEVCIKYKNILILILKQLGKGIKGKHSWQNYMLKFTDTSTNTDKVMHPSIRKPVHIVHNFVKTWTYGSDWAVNMKSGRDININGE